MSYSAIVLAAGDGKRMNSANPKVMCEVLGEPMIGWVLDSLKGAGIADENVGVIVGKGADKVKEYLASRGNYRTFLQAERKGTGHAVMQAEVMLAGADNVLVLCGDAPFVNSDTIVSALNEHTHKGSDVTVMSADLPDPASYGRVIRAADGSLSSTA